MKKRTILTVAVAARLLAAGGCVYASGNGYVLKEFRDAAGQTAVIALPWAEDEQSRAQAQAEAEKQVQMQAEGLLPNYDYPDHPEIGDVYLGPDGYEEVIAVADDGAYITAPTDTP